MYGSFSSSSGARSATGGSRPGAAPEHTPVGRPGSPDLRRQGGLSEDDERANAAGCVTTASRAGPPPCGLRWTTGKQGRPRFYRQANPARLVVLPLEDLALGLRGG